MSDAGYQAIAGILVPLAMLVFALLWAFAEWLHGALERFLRRWFG